MDFGKPGENGLRIQGSWIPTTPVKPILPRPPPIYTEGQGNQLNQGIWLGSETFSSSLTQDSQVSRMVACCESPNCTEVNRGVDNCNEASAGNPAVEFPMDGMARWNNLPFADLLALADAASAASGNAALQGNEGAANGSFMSVSFCEDENNGVHSNLWPNDYCMPENHDYEFPTLYRHTYDLNLPPRTMSDAISSKTIPQLAPTTPAKDMRVGKKQVSEVQNLCANELSDEEREKQGKEVAAALVDASDFLHNTELQNPVADSSFAAVSTPLNENHNPDKGDSHVIDLNSTPQQKPRRKKHRPKVVIEGKPKRTPKPVTPKLAGSKENPTGKRKYVRKKGVNKPSTTPPAEVTGESTDLKTLEPTKKSCRRSLNFDTEGPPQDESSTCKSSINLDSELQAQDFCSKGVQSRSTVQLGKGIKVMVQHREAGIAYDLSCSMNQVLKDYMLLPERQAPGSPRQTKTNPPQAKESAVSQKENTEGEGQLSGHSGQENATNIMLNTNTKTSPRSPNDSNCSTSEIMSKGEQARGSKRKHSHAADQAGPNTPNLDGVHCNILQEYDMMSLVHFPHIYKKKRTEKGQSSTTSNSSCVTTTKNFVRLATTYPQNDAKANPRSSKAIHWISAPQFNAGTVSSTFEAGKDNQNNLQASECMLALKQTGRSTKKRSKGPTRVRDLTSLTRVSKCNMRATHPTKPSLVDGNGQPVENPHKPHTCMDALFAAMHATLARKKRTKKRNCLVSSASSSTNEMQLQQKLVLYNHHLSSSKLLGAPSELILGKLYSVDEIVEQFKHLDINKEGSKFAHQQQNANVSYNLQNQEHNALVIYKRDGTVVPFEGLFNPIKKRRPRPKVDLDEETNRVWKLLLGNINSEGIDGTDEEKAKWWEEERRVFRGRADSFIARMHLVQGDRRFSQWKGSVLDSVIGVFLTQNVSDHLSSSAFMSLAARFPLKSRSNHKPCYEERTSLVVNEPEVCILDPEDSIQWNGKNSNSPVCDQSSMTLHDNEHNEEKAVNSNETSSGSSNGAGTASYTEGDKIAINDTVSSQNSVSSSQNSGNSSPAQTTEKLGSYSESNSEADNLFDGSKPKSSDGSASIVKFLQMARSAMLDEVHNHGSDGMPSDWNSNESCNQYKGVDHDNQRQNINNLDGPQSSLGASVNPSSNYPFNLTPAAGILEVECSEIFREKSRSADISRNKDEHSMSKQSALTIESSSQATVQNKLTLDVQKAARSSGESFNSIQVDDNMIISSQSSAIGNPKIVESLAQVHNIEMQQSLPNLSGETQDVIQKTAESDLNAHGYLFSKEVSEMNAATVKSKSKRVGKEKKAEIDWDILRKQAKANGRKRERTANTMDSLDWEAVRCADVKDIANAIKERGMNNMLAERIQDFLNRMVREHGSIDLEWLRDVPPDQAKEYLLSVRGLGLKSVECVRLLTLHHLAFPVDTNVGRIAVRLGWVPLQPLPESLQLHLLELYPVLESIQKYLWPRLCKLDQRTLYELHYQMITFGKVFCTKSKPNCNSCPMRGECRHFASAFASARLALPGPEERSIVSATENKPADQNSAVIINRLPLPQPQETKQSEENQKSEVAKSGVSYCEPIIEEPATPEPECTQIAENDIEDTFFEDPDEIPTIKLNIEEFTQNLQNYMQNNMALQEGDMSKALVALTPEVASIPMPKLKNVSRLRTEHQVYELPDSHPLLKGLDKREPDDPCSYLLAIWTPGETANSIQPPEIRCSYQDYGKLCDEKECFSCNSIREANSPTVRGTLLIPCRTAMRGSFPLNGTYFQVNEVFADHDSSLNPIDVPRDWIWNLPRRTVYFGTSIPTIFKGLTTEGIQHCFWRGYVCVRGFDQKNRAPRPLMARLHFPASKLMRTKGKADDNKMTMSSK